MSKIDCHAISDIGNSRSENEDQFLIADLVKTARIQTTSLVYDEQSHVAGRSHGKVMLVADGLGGHAAGRRASTLAVDEMISYMVDRMRWYSLSETSPKASDLKQLSDDLRHALQHCQRRILNEASWCPERRGMATTLTVAIVDWPTLHVVHAGDSRCYLQRDGQLRQMTSDHTFGPAFANAGDESEHAPSLSHILWNVVGGKSTELEADVCHVDLKIGDTVLLCTDGLTKHVPDAKIEEVIKRERSASWLCKELTDRALRDGGTDNITVAAARFLGSEDQPVSAISRSDPEMIDPQPAMPCLT